MDILFVSQYFPPETVAPAIRTYELSKNWVKHGHSVMVLTAFPHHPAGTIFEGYRGKLLLRESVDGIRVTRSYVYATANRGFAKRTLSYISFMCSAFLASPFLRSSPQVIVATSPQFLVGVVGYIISRLRRIPFVFEVRDLWPESIVAVGALKNPLIIRILTKIEYFLYTKASLIIGVAESTRRILVRRGVSSKKIDIVPNGVDSGLFCSKTGGLEVRRRYKIAGKFVVSYIGTHGMAHALHRVLEAADLLQEEKNIHFLFVGEGAEKDGLIKYGKSLGLENLTFTGRQAHHMIPAFLNASDVSLVHLRDAPLFSCVLPSKMFEIMAAGRPLILSVRGEAKELVEKINAGLCVEPENPIQLQEAILRLHRDKELRRCLGDNGHRYVMANHSREGLALKYERLLTRLTEGFPYGKKMVS